MLPKSRRLRTPLFKKTLNSKGFFVRSRTFNLKANFVKGLGKSKASCVSPKGQFRKAVERNKARRICYEAVKIYLLKIKEDYILIFNLKKEIFSVSHKELQAELKSAMINAKLL